MFMLNKKNIIGNIGNFIIIGILQVAFIKIAKNY